MLPGTLGVLILKTLAGEPAHGYAIARQIEHVSAHVLKVGESSLYPALQRLLVNGWTRAEWKASELGRRARVYTITAKGHKRLTHEAGEFTKVAGTIIAMLEGT